MHCRRRVPQSLPSAGPLSPEPRRRSRRFFVPFPDPRRASLAAISVTSRRSVTVACQCAFVPFRAGSAATHRPARTGRPEANGSRPCTGTPAVRLDHEHLCVNGSRELSVLHRSGLITRSVKVRATTVRALVLLSVVGVNATVTFLGGSACRPCWLCKALDPAGAATTRTAKEFPRPDKPASSRPRRNRRSKFFRLPGPPLCCGRSHARGAGNALCGL